MSLTCGVSGPLSDDVSGGESADVSLQEAQIRELEVPGEVSSAIDGKKGSRMAAAKNKDVFTNDDDTFGTFIIQ